MKNLNVLFTILLSFFVISVSYGQEDNQTTGSPDKSTGSVKMKSENTTPSSKMSHEITDLENSITKAVENKDSEKFGSFLAKDFQAVYDSGILTKDQEVRRVAKIDIKNNKRSDEKVVFPSDNVAILTYKSVHSGTGNGHDKPGTYNVSSTYVKQDGKWVAVQHTMVRTAK